MDPAKLASVIRKIVAVEVKNQLPMAILEVFDKLNNKSTPDQKQVVFTPKVSTSLKELMDEEVVPVQKPIEKTQKTYTKNPILNQVLNETVSDLRVRERGNMPASVTADFSNIGIQSNDEVNNGNEFIPTLNPSVLDLDKNALPPFVSSALTKNYSSFIKLMDKKRGKI